MPRLTDPGKPPAPPRRSPTSAAIWSHTPTGSRRPALDRKFVQRVQLAVALLGDHVGGRCPQIPYRTVTLLAAAVLYFLDPIDVIPDCIPGAGSLDDALVLDLAWQLAREGIDRYVAARA